MKLNSKFFTTSSLIIFAFPLIAQTAPSSTRPDTSKANGAVCLRLENATSSIRTRVEENKTRWTNRKTERQASWTERLESLSNKLEQRRTEADDRRENHLDALREKYNDPDQQAAIDEFQTTIEEAVLERREAFDQAHKTFKDGVASALTKRHEAMQDALTKMQTAISSAIADAKEACTSGEEAASIRTNLQASIKAARDEFATTRKSLDTVSTEMTSLREKRKEAIGQAQDDFKKALEEAKKSLKLALEEADNFNQDS